MSPHRFVLLGFRIFVSPSIKEEFGLVQVAEQADDLAQDGYMFQTKRFHRRILRLQANMVTFFIERLDRCLVILRHGHNDITVVRRLLLADNHVIPVMYSSFDHAVANHGKHKDVTISCIVLWQRKIIFNILCRCDRHACGDLPNNRNAVTLCANKL